MFNAMPTSLYAWARDTVPIVKEAGGPRADLDESGKTVPYRDSILGPFSPWRVDIPNELPRHPPPDTLWIYHESGCFTYGGLIAGRQTNVLMIDMVFLIYAKTYQGSRLNQITSASSEVLSKLLFSNYPQICLHILMCCQCP